MCRSIFIGKCRILIHSPGGKLFLELLHNVNCRSKTLLKNFFVLISTRSGLPPLCYNSGIVCHLTIVHCSGVHYSSAAGTIKLILNIYSKFINGYSRIGWIVISLSHCALLAILFSNSVNFFSNSTCSFRMS